MNGALFFFLLIGVAIIALGIYVVVHNHRLRKGGRLVTAVVAYSESTTVNIMSQEISGYKNIIQIDTRQGTVEKELLEEHPREVGSCIRGYYIEKSDQFMKEEDVKTNSGAGPYILIGFGVLWCAIILSVVWMNQSDRNSQIGGMVFGYVICILFIIVGGWIGLVTPIKRKKALHNCHTVPGTLVDYRAERDDDGTSYYPVYEYYVYGEPRKLPGNVGGSSSKYRQIGRRVTIVINDETGDVYCAEDGKSSGRIGIIFVLVGIGVLALLIYMGIQEKKEKQAQEAYRSESVTGGAGQSGNTYTKPTEFDVEAFREGLNAENYCYEDINMDMPDELEFVEYYYTPSDFSWGTFAYHVALYENGVGQMTLFPSVSVSGRSFHQYISFWCGPDAILQLGEDLEQYDFNNLDQGAVTDSAADYGISSVGAGDISEYIYYYDGEGRIGSGGTSLQTEPIVVVRGHFIEAVPDSVWAAAEAEMQEYFKE